MRESYAATERVLEENVYEVHSGTESNWEDWELYSQLKELPPDWALFHQLEELPSELPVFPYHGCYIYIINLDEEVFTMDYDIHWKLNNIPREDNLWLNAIVKSIYSGRRTVSLDRRLEDHIPSMTLEIGEGAPNVDYDYHIVTPKNRIERGGTAFLTLVLAKVLDAYRLNILRFGGEWSPDSFPFRELIFAFLSIASGQANFDSPPILMDHQMYDKAEWHGWLNDGYDRAYLLQFGSMSRRPGDSPGVSPAETIYWLEGVVVCLTLKPSGEDITRIIDWSRKQGYTSFQAVIISLFEVTLAEVFSKDDKPYVKMTRPILLSPLKPDYCSSRHPRERPIWKDGMKQCIRYGESLENHVPMHCTSSVNRLRRYFPGFTALVNFFDIAASRRATAKSGGPFPSELYDRILDFVDYETWRACLLVSQAFRSSCLRKYRINNRARIIQGPYVVQDLETMRNFNTGLATLEVCCLSFDFEDMETGDVFPTTIHDELSVWPRYRWMPVIGSDRKATMTGVELIVYKPDDTSEIFYIEDGNF